MNLTLTDKIVLAENQSVTIRGVPNSDAKKFIINIGSGEGDIALNFIVDFDRDKIIIKTLQGGNMTKEKQLDRFPFGKGQEFKVIITLQGDKFIIKMPGDYNESYPNYFGATKFKLIQVLQDVKVSSFNID